MTEEEMQKQIKEIEESAASEPEELYPIENHDMWCECIFCIPGA